jgi:aspartyl-tRNA(Asn)/glutamyl-tRNA(Gln) amidotransferase subunit C
VSPTDPETVRKLAHLARLALSEEELRRLAPELERILEAFAVLARHPGVPATAVPGAGEGTSEPAAGRAREDQPQPSLPRAELLAAAGASSDGFFAVPKTVGGER